jgi:tetratricopeptide (TPR) repeat protein
MQQKSNDAILMAAPVLEAMPTNEDALFARAEALRQTGKLADSKKDFQKLTELSPGNAIYWHRLATSEILLNDSANALTHFRKAVQLQPDFIAAINDLLFVHLKSKQFDAALAELDKLSKPPTPQDEIHRLRGQIYVEKGDQASAEREFRKAIEVNPQNYQSYIILGQLNLQRNNLPQALKEVDQLISANPKFAPGFLLKGFYLQTANDPAGAMKSYREVLKLDPENPIAANNLAYMLCETNTNLDEALTLAKAARKKVPESPEFADTLGWIYYKQKNYVLAVNQLLFSVNNRPKATAENYYHLGMAYYASGDPSHAKESLRKALELKPDFPGSAEAQNVLRQLK